MKVCILVHNNIAADSRVIKQADALAEAGYDVTVIGVRNPNDEGKIEWISNKPWRIILYNRDKRSFEGKLNWFKTALRSHGAEFIAKYWSLKEGIAENALIRAYPELIKIAIEQNASVYHANDLNTLPIACRAAETVGGKVIYDAHEFYTDEQGEMSDSWRKLVSFVENTYIRNVKCVITVSPGIAEALRELYSINNIEVIYNVPPLDWLPKKNASKRENLSVLYQGRIGFGYRGLEDILEAVPKLNDGIEIHFRGFLSPNVKSEIEKVAQRLGRPIFIHPPVTPSELIQIAADHDVGLVLTQPVSRHTKLTIPNKIFEYFLSGLAVVSTNLPGPNIIMNMHEVGFTYTAGNVDSLAGAINRLAHDNELLEYFQRNSRRVALEYYNWDKEKQKLLSIYEALCIHS